MNPHGMTLTRLERLMFDQIDTRTLAGGPMAALLARPKARVTDPLFGRLLPKNPVDRPSRPEALKRLAGLAESLRGTAGNVKGPAAAGLTFFGQFVDHDVTLDVVSELGRATAPETVANVRTPALDLDCVYGAGPEGTPLLYWEGDGKDGFLYMGNAFNPNDLPRNHQGRAIIGDPRNDENAIIAALQGLFIKFANIVLHKVRSNPGNYVGPFAELTASPFNVARQIVRWHYQWLIMREFLPAFVDVGVLETVEDTLRAGDLPAPFVKDTAIIPIEFAVAAYRFGHATVQSEYVLANNETILLFANEGQPGLPHFGWKEAALDFDLATMFDHRGAPAPQRARPVGLDLTPEIFDLPFVMAKPIEAGDLTFTADQLKMLPARNIFRDRFTFELPSGQQVASAMGLKPLARTEVMEELDIDKTPLWYYLLQEGAEQSNGKLGAVGGTLVATVLMRILREDAMSVWHHPDWMPTFGDEDGFSFGRLIEFVTAEWAGFPYKDEVMTPNTRPGT